MGLLSDTLRHLLATDAGERRAGLAGIAGRMFGVEPVRVRHRSMGEALPFDVVHYPKTSGRAFAVTMTLGLGEDLGAERIAATLADARDPDDDRIAGLVAATVSIARGSVGTLPAGLLGRSSHDHAVVTDPWLVSERDLSDYERIVGARLDLVVPVTAREAAWIAGHGTEAWVAAMRGQGVVPYADRPAGEVRLG